MKIQKSLNTIWPATDGVELVIRGACNSGDWNGNLFDNDGVPERGALCVMLGGFQTRDRPGPEFRTGVEVASASQTVLQSAPHPG